MRAVALATATLVIAVTAQPAGAARLFVPFAVNKVIDGKLYRTKLLLGNRGSVARSVSVRYIPANEPADAALPTIPRTFVPPRGFGGQMVIDSAVPAGGLGMLEVSGAPQVSVGAILELIEAGVLVAVEHVPTLGPTEQVQPRSFVPLQSLLDLDVDSGFVGFADLGSTDPQQHTCFFALTTPEGGLFAAGALLEPGTVRVSDLREFFDFRGAQELTGQGEIQCTFAPAYVYVLITREGTDRLTFSGPASLLKGGFQP